ncbi:hypothetical protein ACJ41O_006840 [Fusarium nematophilum]
MDREQSAGFGGFLVAEGDIHAKLVTTQDLSVEEKELSDDTSDDDVTKGVEPAQSLAKQSTVASLKDREGFDLYRKADIVHTIAKMIHVTADVKN